MTTNCELVAQCVAFGEPLGALAEHVTSCSRCQRMVDMPGLLTKTRHEVDPGLGFSSRMTVGAQHLMTTRHRRRMMAGLAAAVATVALGAFVVTRETGEDNRQPVAMPVTHVDDRPAGKTGDQANPPPVTDNADPDVVTLVHYANTDRNRRLSAKWSKIEKSLEPYRKLVEGVTP